MGQNRAQNGGGYVAPLGGGNPFRLTALTVFDGGHLGMPSKTEIRRIEGYELVQFTGLLDKNGMEIYEGDIVRNFECQLAHDSIEWVRDGFSLNYHNGTSGVIHPALLEVIGNIYENPELLGAEKATK